VERVVRIETVKGKRVTKDARLWGRFSQVEKLPPKRKQIAQILDTFTGSEKTKKSG